MMTRRSSSSRDHPRVCGNHDAGVDFRTPEAGSPPRVREPRIDNSYPLEKARITPACAGTTAAESSTRVQAKDHPRVCGNHVMMHCGCTRNMGSPPRVREPPGMSDIDMVLAGITPACAGTTG